MSDPSRLRNIVLCADDFGANGAASRAIIDLARTGAISAASCLVLAPYSVSYGALLKSNAPQLSLGLHLDLTEFASAPIRATLHRWLFRGFVLRNVDQCAVAAEINRQLNRFEALMDAAPAFVDGHCHVHQIPGIREPLLRELSRRYGSSVAIRSTRSSLPDNPKTRFIQALGGRTLHALIAESSLHSNADFGGAYDFKVDSGYPALMEHWLQRIGDGGLIMCHPELPARVGVPRSAREAEYCFLASAGWSELRARCNVRLRPFTPGFVDRDSPKPIDRQR